MNQLSLRNNWLKCKTSKKIPHHFRKSCRIYPKLVEKLRKISTYNQLDLETLGSQPIMPKNLPGHWLEVKSCTPNCWATIRSSNDDVKSGQQFPLESYSVTFESHWWWNWRPELSLHLYILLYVRQRQTQVIMANHHKPMVDTSQDLHGI
jgi:hypothetical protein